MLPQVFVENLDLQFLLVRFVSYPLKKTKWTRENLYSSLSDLFLSSLTGGASR